MRLLLVLLMATPLYSQDGGPAHGDDAQGLIRRVEHERLHRAHLGRANAGGRAIAARG